MFVKFLSVLFVLTTFHFFLNVNAEETAVATASVADDTIGARAINDTKQIAIESWNLGTSPIRWGARDWATLGGVVGVSFGVSLLDKDIRKLSLFKDKGTTKNTMERVGSTWGTFGSIGLMAGMAFAEGVFRGNSWSRESAVLMTSTLLVSHLISHAGKYGVGRRRPPMKDGEVGNPHDFKPFSENVGYHSSPSGHLSYAFTASFAMASQFQSYTMKTFFYTLSGISAFARIYSNAHWPSDVVFTGLISYFLVSSSKSRLDTVYNKDQSQGKNDHYAMGSNVYILPGYRSLSMVIDF